MTASTATTTRDAASVAVADVQPIKVLAVDIDGTLTTDPDGESEVPVLRAGAQELIETCDARNILVVGISRADPQRKRAQLEAAGIARYFVRLYVDWRIDKAAALDHVLTELRCAPSAAAYVDDRARERDAVAARLPEVRLYTEHDIVGQPDHDVPGLLDRPEFNPPTNTHVAGWRRAQILAQSSRDDGLAQWDGPDDTYLHDKLQPVMTIMRVATPEQLDRSEELAARVSQMTTTGVAYSAEELTARLHDPDQDVLVATIEDNLGSLDIIGLMLIDRRTAGAWHLQLLITSCRASFFGAGDILLSWLVDQAAQANVHLVGDFRPTNRNADMESLYRSTMRFDDTDCECTTRLSPAADPATQRLHRIPERIPAPPEMTRVTSPTLGVPDAPATDWPTEVPS
jgi:methoxymalonate biosynthesis protein